MFDLVDDDWFGTYDPKVTIHVIDSSRPMSLRNIFARGQNAERVLIWNDEDTSQFTDIEEAWKMLEVSEPTSIIESIVYAHCDSTKSHQTTRTTKIQRMTKTRTRINGQVGATMTKRAKALNQKVVLLPIRGGRMYIIHHGNADGYRKA